MSAIRGRVLAIWVAAPVIGVLLGAAWLGAPAGDLRALAQFLVVSEVLSLALAWLALRLMRKLGFGGIQTKIAVTYVLGVAIVLINVVLSSMLMFFSSHDAGLLAILLLFSALVAVGFGQVMTRSMTRGLEELAEATIAIAGGDLERRVAVQTGDEVEAVGAAFNAMAERLERAQAREAAALLAQRSLIVSASHDLRTPLTSLRATIEALAEGVVDDPADVARYLATAQAEIRHLGRLVDDLFELTRLNAGVLQPRMETASLRDLVSDTLQSLTRTAAERRINLSGDVAADVDPVCMDPHLMQRALTNLVENGVRHTPDGGAVRITGRRIGDRIVITVSDTGEGIEDGDLPRIFDAFYRGEAARSRREGSGAGLGLSITRAIVESHGGAITASSPHGAGAVFEIRMGSGSRADGPQAPSAE